MIEDSSEPTLRIRQLREGELREWQMLLVAEYRNAPAFTIHDISPLLEPPDPASLVLVAEEPTGLIIATMSMSRLSRDGAERRLDAALPAPVSMAEKYAVLERAATRTDYAHRGVNSVLRLVLIDLAVANDVDMMVGTFYGTGPRIRTMAELGYRFFDLPEDRDQWNVSGGGRKLAAMDLREDGRRAIATLRERHRALLDVTDIRVP